MHTAKLDKTDMGTSIEISPKYAVNLFNCNFFLGFFSKFCIIENSSDLSFPPLLMARKVKGISQVIKIIELGNQLLLNTKIGGISSNLYTYMANYQHSILKLE